MSLLTTATLLLCIACSESDSRHKQVNSGNTNSTTSTIHKDTMTNYFPFKLSNESGQATITADLESPELYPKYVNFFESHEYSGNRYCWEGHITQILEKLNPELLNHIEFDPEAGYFFAIVDTKENQLKIAALLTPIFADLSKLEAFVKNADRTRIDD